MNTPETLNKLIKKFEDRPVDYRWMNEEATTYALLVIARSLSR